jgi:hypothetical protein
MSIKPIRIQLSRRAGYRMHDQSPDGRPVVKVARGKNAKWGNPFKVGVTILRSGDIVAIATNAGAVQVFKEMLEINDRNYPSNQEIVSALKGKHLACWCKPGTPCHADVLLELANGEGKS